MTAALDPVLARAIGASGDELRVESQILLWFVRNVMQVDELDAYQYVLEDDDNGIDAMLLERPLEAERSVLHVLQAKVWEAPEASAIRAWAADVRERVADGFYDRDGGAELRGLAASLGLSSTPADRYDVRPTLVCLGELTSAARKAARETGVAVYDRSWLISLASSLEGPGLLEAEIEVEVPEAKRFWTKTGHGDLLVCEVPAHQIAAWPGIEDRTLFGLNVRGELRQDRVRSSLDSALEAPDDAANFIAYHNGLTVLCGEIVPSHDRVLVRGISVVNGAQSVLAFKRREQRLAPTQPAVLVKFVVHDQSAPAFATEVARRSNTQTAVNPRNLRANDPLQVRLAQQVPIEFPGTIYVTRPDATIRAVGEGAIENDEAAQWLCAMFEGQPWLAVKRTELFRDPTYERLFGQVTPSHVVLASRARRAIESQKTDFPTAYTRAWRLTTVMALYLLGQAIRASLSTQGWIDEPAAAFAHGDPDDRLAELAGIVGAVMDTYHAERVKKFGHDDFKVDFKKQNTALILSRKVTKAATARR